MIEELLHNNNLNSSVLVQSFLTEGLIVISMAVIGALCRISLFEEDTNVLNFVRRIISAIFAGTIIWLILRETNLDPLYKIVSYIIVGLDAPSIIKSTVKGINIIITNPLIILDWVFKGVRFHVDVRDDEDEKENKKHLKPRKKSKGNNKNETTTTPQ